MKYFITKSKHTWYVIESDDNNLLKKIVHVFYTGEQAVSFLESMGSK